MEQQPAVGDAKSAAVLEANLPAKGSKRSREQALGSGSAASDDLSTVSGCSYDSAYLISSTSTYAARRHVPVRTSGHLCPCVEARSMWTLCN